MLFSAWQATTQALQPVQAVQVDGHAPGISLVFPVGIEGQPAGGSLGAVMHRIGFLQVLRRACRRWIMWRRGSSICVVVGGGELVAPDRPSWHARPVSCQSACGGAHAVGVEAHAVADASGAGAAVAQVQGERRRSRCPGCTQTGALSVRPCRKLIADTSPVSTPRLMGGGGADDGGVVPGEFGDAAGAIPAASRCWRSGRRKRTGRGGRPLPGCRPGAGASRAGEPGRRCAGRGCWRAARYPAPRRHARPVATRLRNRRRCACRTSSP